MVSRKPREKPEHEEQTVRFNALHFDPKNPRGEFTDDEEAIRAAFGEDDRTLKLATHMAEHGQNPLDRIALIAHPRLPGHYVVREGNRRLCAMQLLRDPQRAPTPAIRKSYQQLAANGKPVPEMIDAVVFHAAPQAKVWMSVKHEGEQGGLGTVPWGTDEKARFNEEGQTSATRPKNPNVQAVKLLDYAVKHGLITADERKRIATTTVTRYLPNMRAALGLLNNEDCTTNADLDQFNAGLKAFFEEALPTGDPSRQPRVHSRSSARERDSFAEHQRQQGTSPSDRSHKPYDPAKAAPAKAASKAATRSATHPGKRRQLVLSSFVVTYKDPVLLRMVSEGKGLNPDEARFSCNYLNRAILERVVHLYAKKFGVGAHGEFSQVIDRVKTHANSLPEPPSKGIASALTKAGDKKSSYSYEVLGSGVHGGNIPSAADNRSNWESLQPALECLLSKLR